MHQVARNLPESNRQNPRSPHVETTLYELIEAIDQELRPGEEELIAGIILDLAIRRKITFMGNATAPSPARW